MPEQARVGSQIGGNISRTRKEDGDPTTRLIVRTLEEGLSKQRGQPVHIRELRREFLDSSSSFRTERLRVSLDGGQCLRVFFKDLNPDHQMEKARALREIERAPSDRELKMYQWVLSPGRFGTLQLYAFRWEPEHGVHWLFLEDAGSTLLHNFDDLDRWILASRWAARFHAATRHLPDSQTSFLPRYDRDHYRRCADHIARILTHVDARERQIIERGRQCYLRRIERLTQLPRCVIHGQFYGKNIMLRRGNPEQLIAVIDWETAAMGPAALDLVSVTSGKWNKEQRQAMWRAYFDEYQAETGERLDWEAFCRDLADVTLYQSLEWIGWWGCHRSLSRHFFKFMKELESTLEEHFAAS
jgi:thiamine kinase-like enzyme